MPTRTFNPVFDADFVITEHNGTMSREQIMLKRGAAIAAATVLAQETVSKLWVPLNPAGADGSEIPRGILRNRRPARAGADTRRSVAQVRHTDVNGKKLIWPAGITVNQRKAFEATLANVGILVRY